MSFIDNLKQIVDLGLSIYIYCTDFVINLANLFNLSYYEVNFILFCVLYPVLLVASFVLYMISRYRYIQVKKHNIKK
jgi:hypothetical protein